jgi:2-keto-3-deoxygluconate permease
MNIKRTIEKVPGGIMVVPLMLGALLNTIDQAHLPPLQSLLRTLGAPPTPSGHYEFLRIGGFTEALFKNGALALIGLFLVCVGAQMNFRVGRRALKKGLVITGAKLGTAVAVGYAIGALTNPFNGFLGLSMVAIIAAMENGNGGMYVALTGEYGNRSDVGAISVISLNDGPFFTLLALGLLGEKFPFMAFVAVLVPMLVGFSLGQLDEEIREFLKPGEQLTIPFFAFALGAGMNFATFFNPDVVLGGLFLGVATVLLTGGAGALALRLCGERSTIGAVAEASTAGNAVQTPLAVATAAALAAQTGLMDPDRAAQYRQIVNTATAQVSISTMTTAILCPIAVIFWDRFQRRRGIDARREDV